MFKEHGEHEEAHEEPEEKTQSHRLVFDRAFDVHLGKRLVLHERIETFSQIKHRTIGLLGLHAGYDIALLKLIALGIGEIGFERASRRHVDGVILIANDDDESSIVATHTKAVANVLSKAEGIVVLDVVYHDNCRLDAQLIVELKHSLVDAANCCWREYTIGIGDILGAIGQVG